MENEYFASINDVSKRLSIPAHTLRYWEKQFPTVIRPTTGAGGRRYYRPETVTRLIIIQDLLYNHGMTIAGVKKLIHDGKFPKSIDGVSVGAVTGNVASVAGLTGTSVTRSDNSAEINAAIGLLTQAKNLLAQ